MLNGGREKMFYGVEQSTDLRDRRTMVKRFASESAPRRRIGNGGGEFTYADPELARNWHRAFSEGYELNGRIDRKNGIFSEVGTRDYPRCATDNLAAYIHRF
jgi:hypothetical protein